MIIKFQTKNRWVIFGEIDHVEYEEIKKSTVEEQGCSYGDTLIYEHPYNTGNAAGSRLMELAFFSKNMTEATVVHAYSPIYLMNDNGKTIEII